MAKANNMKMRRYVLYAAEWFTLKGKENKQTRYLLQYSCLPPPLFMLIITLMQIGAYFCYAYGEPLSPVGPIPFKSLFILNPERRTEQFWRYFTYMFIHIGYVSHTAHIGGFVAGLLLGIVLLRNLRLKKWERVAWWICLIAYLMFNTICLVWIYSGDE
ncbi:Rhomboid domain-containing protein [Aphelenchoides besseyi]|nr:Rhomboid domain-containing protein [Aphelenchoides besseyi]